jgi:5,10-methenyltetrahydrofolate synthetase
MKMWQALEMRSAPPDIAQWRKAERAARLERRTAVPESVRRAADERINELLVTGFPLLAGKAIGFYWPFKGEADPRVALHRFRTIGSRTALPMVVEKKAPLRFLEWRPGVETVPGVFGLPIPQGTDVLVPEVVLMPPIAFDAQGYRLGYGGGYFDRTLASIAPPPLKIGIAREADRIETIHPQPHDIPMDFVVTEAGIHAVGSEGLALLQDAAEAQRLAQRIVEQRRPMSRTELAALLNALLEAERAGAKVLSAFIDELPLSPGARAELHRVQRDESRNCVTLMGLLSRMGCARSERTGDFVAKALAVRGTRQRLDFLNKGQAWVARKIAEALPRLQDPDARAALREMHDSHLSNIRSCDALIEAAA